MGQTTMTIAVGDKLPDATLLRIGENGAESLSLSDKLKGRKVVIFGLPGAFTGTCTTAHLPSFMRTAKKFAEKGVEEIICIAVNDPFVMNAWDEATGAKENGVTLLSDAASDFTTAIGMNFDAPPVGFISRSKRYALLAEDGVVKVLNEEVERGACDLSTGEAFLDAI